MNSRNWEQPNPDAARFCMHRGTPLRARSPGAPAPGGFLDQYLLQELLDKLRSARVRAVQSCGFLEL